MMKSYSFFRTVIFLFLSTTSFFQVAGQTVIEPSVKSATSFAIVIDKASYEKAGEEVLAYREVVENDGLGTYVLSDNWSSPDEIREWLIKQYHNKKQPLEGAVFVGDVPIPMLRDAQHMTSAFKMNQKYDWQQSSVPSDRYYDDFDLKFDFLKQDTLNPLFFYYSLRADSEQILRSEIYTARIKPLEGSGPDKYEQLRSYLQKVVAVRSSEKDNKADNLTVARGHGYNSESRVAWSGEQLALKEQFAYLFKTGNFVKFMDFDTYWPMKPYWLNEVLRPDLDIMLFHHHGSNDYQYINGYKSGSDVNTSKENIKIYLRGKIRSAIKKGKDKEETILYYMDYLDVPRSWCEEAFDPEMEVKDSLMNEDLDIKVRDILAISPNARFVMFDACYNGSFYEDNYVAGAYIFNDGKTIVTQGNTVNALQDKWPDEFIGLLGKGLRVGLWSKQVQFLETHVIGDPTFHFSADADSQDIDINRALTVRKQDVRFWKKILQRPDADLQAMALRVLYDNNYQEISGLLKKTYFTSSYMVVRLEALRLLSLLDNDDFIEVLSFAAADSYELTRRLAVEYIARNGSDILIPALARMMLNDNTSERINFKIGSNLKMVDLEKLEKELLSQASKRDIYDKSSIDDYLKKIESEKQGKAESIATMKDKTKSVKNIQFEISRYRNHPVSADADVLLSILSDAEYDASLRLSAAEVLGWYNYSFRKGYIIDRLAEIASSMTDIPLQNEINKTIRRLSAK